MEQDLLEEIDKMNLEWDINKIQKENRKIMEDSGFERKRSEFEKEVLVMQERFTRTFNGYVSHYFLAEKNGGSQAALKIKKLINNLVDVVTKCSDMRVHNLLVMNEVRKKTRSKIIDDDDNVSKGGRSG